MYTSTNVLFIMSRPQQSRPVFTYFPSKSPQGELMPPKQHCYVLGIVRQRPPILNIAGAKLVDTKGQENAVFQLSISFNVWDRFQSPQGLVNFPKGLPEILHCRSKPTFILCFCFSFQDFFHQSRATTLFEALAKISHGGLQARSIVLTPWRRSCAFATSV